VYRLIVKRLWTTLASADIVDFMNDCVSVHEVSYR